MAFKPASRRNSRLRMALTGPAGAGKTFTMLMMLCLLAARRAVIDSERGSASKYAKKSGTSEGPGNWSFDVNEVEEKNPVGYIGAIREAGAAGYPVLGVDSLSHSWLGALEQIDRLGGWVRGGKTVSPQVAKVVDSMLAYPGHVIATLRSKSEHVIEKDEKTGRTTMRKVGMAPVAREGTEFEFDVILDLAVDGSISVSKTRCPSLTGRVFDRDDVPKIVDLLKSWLDEGAPLSPLESLLERVRFASTVAELQALIPEIKALSPEDRAALKPTYDAKKLELTQAAELAGDVP